MSENDEWVHVALMDDAIVADLIVRFRQAPRCLRKGKAPDTAAAPLCPRWNVRHQRSKQVIKEKARESPLSASPTTPLSWSEATSVSGEGAEESSRFPRLINSARSESLPVAVNEEHINKRGRKRKQNVAELRAVESLLLNESIALKSELEMLRSNVEKVRAFDVPSRHMMETSTAAAASKQAALNQSVQPVVARDPTCSISQGATCIKLDQCLPNLSSEGAKEPSFLLPDLNLPADESGFEG
ncbi:uncharacterized protein LOC119990752 isoform X2 [Tripterygium wilfordii]|uniref:uncharacterized protein LOC119990752 isoform X2 n=1 Tax=Tripterygium wilfordii TaxID=458696 RepID=UPI0018F80445|nr:uncharacterized protein LOC119990752 isoform X2 [Tripterygium wilfordii]